MRTRVAYEGWVGGPGLTTFYHLPATAESDFSQAQVDAALARVRTFCNAMQAYYANGVQPTINPQVDILAANDGSLTGAYVGAVGGVISSSAAGVPYAPAVAILTKWKTAGIVHGHAVKGRTFISPLAAGMVSSGVVIGAAISGIPSLAAPLITGAAAEPRLCIWSRPVKVGTPTVPVRDGSAWLVTGCSVPSKLAVLRSRRDS
jgi:hypothetical protein